MSDIFISLSASTTMFVMTKQSKFQYGDLNRSFQVRSQLCGCHLSTKYKYNVDVGVLVFWVQDRADFGVTTQKGTRHLHSREDFTSHLLTILSL